jgi:hypothetical protein
MLPFLVRDGPPLKMEEPDTQRALASAAPVAADAASQTLTVLAINQLSTSSPMPQQALLQVSARPPPPFLPMVF